MSEIRANTITDAAGTGAPDFPNGIELAGSAVTATAAELNVLDGITGIASQAQAEAGTSSTTLMTPQRVSQAMLAQIGADIAAQSYGAVGTYAFLGTASNIAGQTTLASPGATVAGSSLRAIGVYAFPDTGAQIDGSALSGTWRSMGFLRNPSTVAYQVGTVMLRIS